MNGKPRVPRSIQEAVERGYRFGYVGNGHFCLLEGARTFGKPLADEEAGKFFLKYLDMRFGASSARQ